MVSFSCEACGDIVTKKSLDKHRNQCRGASFSCLDCSKHFAGTDYRSHTSCISEAQKYQGHLYREKDSKGKADNKRKSMGRNDPSQAMVPRRAYVEDAPEGDEMNAIAMIDVPPRAPTPPPVSEAIDELPDAVNVFDFLVTDDTPNGVKTAQPQIEKAMVEHNRSVRFANGNSVYSQHTNGGASTYSEVGFSYGESPVSPSYARYDSWQDLTESQRSELMAPPPPVYQYVTPMSKDQRKERRDKDKHASTSEKKRKRHQVDDLDLSTTKRPTSRDGLLPEPPTNRRVLHSGLTGGLTKLVTDSDFYADRISAGPTPISPATRTRREEDMKNRRKSSYVSYATTKPTASKHAPDDKHHYRSRSAERNHHDDRHHRSRSLDRSERSTYHDDRYRRTRPDSIRNRESFSSEDRQQPHRKKPVRAIEYPLDRIDRPASVQPTSTNQMVTYRSRGDLFMSFINKGPDSERGCSINKILKRYHRDRDVRGEEKDDEDKELWKCLRLRKNDRGEIVLFM